MLTSFLKFSDGFRRKIFGLLSTAAVLAAFSALSQAVKGIDLSVAYALWGGFGIAATLAAGWILFGQRLNRKGWIGFGLAVGWNDHGETCLMKTLPALSGSV